MITALYALPLAALYILLSVRVAAYRKANRISLGDGGSAALTHRIRAHGNLAEYAPLGLVLMTLAELAHAPVAVVHLAGLALVAGRGLHAWAIGFGGPFLGRVVGMALTFCALAVAALAGAIASL